MQIKIMDIKFHQWAILILLTIGIEHPTRVAGRKLNASQAFDENWSTASDLENELECMLQQQKRTRSAGGSSSSSSGGGWSGWSEWSTCSRSCDGGIMQQIRRCRNGNSCRGENVRYRICNMQSCPEQQDFRAQQCSTYDDVPYDGTLYKWTPHYDYVEPCALTCRGRPAHLTDDISRESETPGDDSQHYDELSVVVQLSEKVHDGTTCRAGSLDMCIQGKCQRVGCDLKIGSTKKIDVCGVCGGDGSSCSQPLFQWETAQLTPCSVSCGGGYQMSQPVCRKRLTGEIVDDGLCGASSRPEPSVLLCNTHTCPPRWITDEWSPCSRLCGQGYRERMVVCAEENNGIKTRVADMMCQTPKPPSQETCMIEECPKWEVEEWTGCSVSCGQGIHMRAVECKSDDGRLSAKCDPHTKPAAVQQCSTRMSCDGGGDGVPDRGAKKKNRKGSTGGGTIIIGSSGPVRGARVDNDEPEDDADDGPEEDDPDMGMGMMGGGDESEGAAYKDQPAYYALHTSNRLHHDEPGEPIAQRLSSYSPTDQPSPEPTFIKDNEWSPCSVTCNEGIRRRPYRCKIFLEYSRTIATVNDTLCEGPKPHDEVERCVEEPCMLPSHGYEDHYPRDSIKVGVSEPGKTYVWREQGYTSCSASCLGGVEELIINCVREDNGRVVSPFLCSPETKPEARVRTCNDRPCPPRWNYSDYTPCSKSCGIGIKTREVQCIHEVTRGGDNAMVVPNSMCPQPPPADRQYCNVLDCPVRWEVGEWSKCSHTCGYGFKERKVECKQIMAQEHKIERPEVMCPSAKPPDKKPCAVKPCPPEDPKPVISISNTTHIQHDPKKSKITLKVGGAGVVFFGTQVKIKCPVKRYNRTKIKWSKDHKPLARSRMYKVSKKGALRILNITFNDAGVYTCHAGLSSAEIHIEVKAKPGQNIDELLRQETERLIRERSESEALTSADMIAAEGINGTQSTRRRQQSNGRNRRPKSDGLQRATGGGVTDLRGDKQTQFVQQQTRDGLPQPASASSGGSRTQAMLAMPYFQALLSNLQLLWPLQKFSNSRGHHMLVDKGLQIGIDIERGYEVVDDEPAKSPQLLTKDLKLSSSGGSMRGVTSTTTTIEPPIDSMGETAGHQSAVESTHLEQSRWQTTSGGGSVGGVGDFGGGNGEYAGGYGVVTEHTGGDGGGVRQTIGSDGQNNRYTYKWLTSDWSECSQRCGAPGNGLRHRSLTCLRERNVPQMLDSSGSSSSNPIDAIKAKVSAANTEVVANFYCEDFGLDIPDTFETCGHVECPNWYAGEWTLCPQSRCFGPLTAIQRRDVSCQFANGTLTSGCSEYERPVSRQECYNERCKGVWRVEPWSECNAPCGRQGIKYRILQCVWYGTRRPAGNACKHQPRPAVMKVCKSRPCHVKSSAHCKDSSRYCRNARSMGLCRLHRYQEKCCKSCKFIFN